MAGNADDDELFALLVREAYHRTAAFGIERAFELATTEPERRAVEFVAAELMRRGRD